MHLRHSLLVGILAASLVGVAVAQNLGPAIPAGPDTAAQLLNKRVISIQSRGQTLATRLIGTMAYSETGTELGRVRDLLIDEAGRVGGFVVNVGGILGVGGKEIAVPFSEADVVKEDDGTMMGIRIGLTTMEAERAPTFRNIDDREASADELQRRVVREAPTSPQPPPS